MQRYTLSVRVVAVLGAALIFLPASRTAAQPAAPGTDVVTPLPSSNPPPPAALPPPAAPAPPTATELPPPPPEREYPFYARHWVWVAVAVLGLTTLVILTSSSGPNEPATRLGNMRAN